MRTISAVAELIVRNLQ